MNLLFFDGECPLCQRAVRFVIARDRHCRFLFAPLQGKTAAKELSKLLRESFDTLVLITDYQTQNQRLYIEGKGALRVLWLLGGWRALLGVLSFLPSGLFDFFYRWVARRRYRLFSRALPLNGIDFSGRLLD